MSLPRLLLRIYKLTVSPLLVALTGPVGGCRFHPTCSEYCVEAIEVYGFWRGSWIGLKRLCRCHPWGGAGLDPVPRKHAGH